MEEPSVLDYLKSKLNPWREKIRIPSEEDSASVSQTPAAVPEATEPLSTTARPDEPAGRVWAAWPWLSVLAFLLAFMAQRLLEPPDRSPYLAIGLYLAAAGLLILAIRQGKWCIPALQADVTTPLSIEVRRNAFVACLALILLAFIAFGGNRFTAINLTLWLLALAFLLRAVWQPEEPGWGSRLKAWVEKVRRPPWTLRITAWGVLVALAVVVAIFFRFYHLNQVPGEMFSDHAEKLLDVGDVLDGQWSIFFPRNTGREAIQMYLTTTIATLLGTGLSFISLKIGTALAGLLALPYIYLLGKEIGNRWVGLLAFVLAGMAYWPNVISRVGLRFPLYPLFVAPTLYYLIRGLRTQNRNLIVLSGLALGLGLHGYSPMRLVPLVVVVGMGLYLLHAQSRGKRLPSFWALVVLAFVAFVVFLPLLRYMLEYPEMFGYRAFSRLSTTERAYPGPLWQIFLSNLWNAESMFFWKNGNIWVHSVTDRPALDVVTAALYFLGIVILLVRYLRQRNWVDLFLLLSVPLLMLPSILSLAFPEENPSLNRTGGAIIPVFIIAAVALEGLLGSLFEQARTHLGKGVVVAFGLLILGTSANQNYDLVFNQYNQQFMNGAWNTSEIGHVIRSFADSVGSADTAYVVPYPYWVDTRLVGINAGYPRRDFALWPESFGETLADTRAKLFVLKPEDRDSLAALRELYPTGAATYHPSTYVGKDFILFTVPQAHDQLP